MAKKLSSRCAAEIRTTSSFRPFRIMGDGVQVRLSPLHCEWPAQASMYRKSAMLRVVKEKRPECWSNWP